ncbi:tRNA uracil 4-sulfurtransferase ThiI [Amphritea balenae]|uniref:tRNA sulfurtransferase n=1 Tax=Amphritea balenae TaxID=452629 RepID=A0A3P1SQL7_9GAMM|nr:tRNA uracil 4-sulfurtransferase ThiI [Amphritea balenae]RRC99413.1 tRNA 4-thiouridine(8) synthase ThiI [Amphritea balenae]GGK71165.1 tRNA sulfurtransferase [Amphritea balenae]
MKFIVKLFPEITIKSKPVRKRFIQRLQSNLQVTLKRLDNDIKVRGLWDKVEVEVPSEDAELREQVIDLMSRTPGILHFLEVVQHPLGDFDNVFQITKAAYADKIKGKTFVVRIKRSGKHEFKSGDLERYVGGGLLQHCDTAGVDLHNPDIKVKMEIREQDLFMISHKHPGLGGYPLGSQEAVLSLISGGFDSVVSSYMTMRRGCKTHFLFFNLGGRAHEIGVKQIAHYIWQQYGTAARVKFISVPFDEVVGEILQNVHHSQMGVVLKRMMMRAGEKVADRMKLPAIVTGESIAQVSSQTLPNLQIIDSSTSKLVVRPLVTMDKQDIIDITKRIGAFDMAKNIPEYCGVISDRPTTNAKLERIEEEEANFDYEVLDKALENAQIIAIDKIVEDINVHADIEAMTKVGANQVIIDIRAANEQERKPLNMPKAEVLIIPFFNLETKFQELDQGKEYLLYCDKGVMSQMHAQNLQDKGFENVKVYRPEV